MSPPHHPLPRASRGIAMPAGGRRLLSPDSDGEAVRRVLCPLNQEDDVGHRRRSTTHRALLSNRHNLSARHHLAKPGPRVPSLQACGRRPVPAPTPVMGRRPQPFTTTELEA